MEKKKKKVSGKLGREVFKGYSSSSDFAGSLWEIFNIPLFSRERAEVLNVIEDRLELDIKRYWIATVNPEFVMTAKKDAKFKAFLKESDLNVIDGIGLVWAREIDKKVKSELPVVKSFLRMGVAIKVGLGVLRGKYSDQVTSGSGLMLDMGEMVGKMNKKIFFLGGFENRAEKTALFFKKKFNLKSSQVDWSSGAPYLDNKEVVKKINKFKPDVLFVAYGMKKQEFWIRENLKKIDVGLVMGVGRSFDYYSGELKRAPELWRKIGLEWLYSLFKEPKRFKRQLVLPKFIWNILIK